MGVISLSVYLLGVAIVPLLTAPLSEICSRMIVLQATDVLFIPEGKKVCWGVKDSKVILSPSQCNA